MAELVATGPTHDHTASPAVGVDVYARGTARWGVYVFGIAGVHETTLIGGTARTPGIGGSS